MAVTTWYIRRGATILGPFTEARLNELRSNGQLGPGDQISRDKNTWQPAVESLPAVAVTPLPLAPPPLPPRREDRAEREDDTELVEEEEALTPPPLPPPTRGRAKKAGLGGGTVALLSLGIVLITTVPSGAFLFWYLRTKETPHVAVTPAPDPVPPPRTTPATKPAAPATRPGAPAPKNDLKPDPAPAKPPPRRTKPPTNTPAVPKNEPPQKPEPAPASALPDTPPPAPAPAPKPDRPALAAVNLPTGLEANGKVVPLPGWSGPTDAVELKLVGLPARVQGLVLTQMAPRPGHLQVALKGEEGSVPVARLALQAGGLQWTWEEPAATVKPSAWQDAQDRLRDAVLTLQSATDAEPYRVALREPQELHGPVPFQLGEGGKLDAHRSKFPLTTIQSQTMVAHRTLPLVLDPASVEQVDLVVGGQDVPFQVQVQPDGQGVDLVTDRFLLFDGQAAVYRLDRVTLPRKLELTGRQVRLAATLQIVHEIKTQVPAYKDAKEAYDALVGTKRTIQAELSAAAQAPGRRIYRLAAEQAAEDARVSQVQETIRRLQAKLVEVNTRLGPVEQTWLKWKGDETKLQALKVSLTVGAAVLRMELDKDLQFEAYRIVP